MAYTVTIGAIRCHILSDGKSLADGGGFFGLSPRSLWQEVIAPNAQNMIPWDTRSLLIESGDADMMVVAEDVQLSMKETQLGLVPDLGGTKPLIQAVGYSRALEICAAGRWLGAEEAVASGIAVASSPVPELAERAEALVASMLSAPPNALIETKKLLRDADLRTREQQCEQERDAQRRRITELATLVKGQ